MHGCALPSGQEQKHSHWLFFGLATFAGGAPIGSSYGKRAPTLLAAVFEEQ